MPDINFRLTATDEATPVINRLRQKMADFERPGSSGAPVGGRTPASAGRSANLPSFLGGSLGEAGGAAAGAGGMAGGAAAAAGPLAAIAIVGKAVADSVQKIIQILSQASPMLASEIKLLKTSLMLFLRPIGDLLGATLRPLSRWMMQANRAAISYAMGQGNKPGTEEYLKDYYGSFFYSALSPLVEAFGIDPAPFKEFMDSFEMAYDIMSTYLRWMYNPRGIIIDAANAVGELLGDFTPTVYEADEAFQDMIKTINYLNSKYYGLQFQQPTATELVQASQLRGRTQKGFLDSSYDMRTGMVGVSTITINGNVYGVNDIEEAVNEAMRRSAYNARYS